LNDLRPVARPQAAELGALDRELADDLVETRIVEVGANFQYLVKDVQGRLAYTVALERSNVLHAGRTERQPQFLRVTMLFRREHGAWKIIHRHADTLVDLQLPQA
jgi:ketosteroid isomerase-like protein